MRAIVPWVWRFQHHVGDIGETTTVVLLADGVHRLGSVARPRLIAISGGRQARRR